MTPLASQIAGARFLAARERALLADEPRVGKTGAAVMAADFVCAERILIVTTASGRDVWARGVRAWTKYPRRTKVLAAGDDRLGAADTAIVGWPGITSPQIRAQLLNARWDLVIGDESHSAINFETARTQCFFGHLAGDHGLLTRGALAHAAPLIWLLSGTPIPDNPNNLYPTLRSLFPDRLAGDTARGWPDVSGPDAFMRRYCVTRPKKLGFRYIHVFVRGQHLDELRGRLDGVLLLRTQRDVGITAPIHGFMPVAVPKDDADSVTAFDQAAAPLLAAARDGRTKDIEMHLGPMRRLTGGIKARAIVPRIEALFADGLDKVVLMAWHRDTMQALRDGLDRFGVVGIDGSTSPAARAEAETRFRDDPETRVFVGQITAAGEAIDLSAAALLVFVEVSFRPKDMLQASLRITNHGQRRTPRVQVCTLAGSIDEALQGILLRKWSAIREVLH